MKHPAFVFGLASLVSACAAQPRHPLCNGDGSPACGNIGQVGRSDAANLRAMRAMGERSDAAPAANLLARGDHADAALAANVRARVDAGAGRASAEARVMHAVLGASAEFARELARPDPELSFVIARPATRAKPSRASSLHSNRAATVITRPAVRHPVTASPALEHPVTASPALEHPVPASHSATASLVEHPVTEPVAHDSSANRHARTPLLAAFAMTELALQTARPRLADDDDVAVGNVMSKGGHKHRRLARPLLTAPTEPTLAVQRPRVTEDDDIAVGNVMDKKKQ